MTHDFAKLNRADLVWGSRRLSLSTHIHVMGILNITPDSFYAGSRIDGPARARESAEEMITAGADILDIGGESTRPGSEPVSEAEERARVIPCIRAVRERSHILISIDTRKHSVAEAALEAGADMVNTVGGLADDDEFADFIARVGVPVVLMHMRGTPATMQHHPHYDDPLGEVTAELNALADHARERGIDASRIILDPGIGFGKRVGDNLALIAGVDRIRALGYPVLIGLSRKSFLEKVTGRPIGQRLAGTIAANTVAVLKGADILRVHDVAEAVDAVRLAEAVRDLM